MRLQSYVCGRWTDGNGAGRPLYNPVTGEVIAEADASGIDADAALAFARDEGSAALNALTFAERGAVLKAIADVLAANRDKYGEIARINSGNTAVDAAIDIDGGIGTLRYYARLGRSLGEAHAIAEEGRDQLAREPVFFAGHVWTTRPGVAVQVNAFNFPSWGLWEKVATALLAGAPSMAKPATATAWLSHEMVRDVVASGVVPEGALNLVCGGGEGLVGALRPMDSLAFTGSAETARALRADANILAHAPRLTVEADSVNATIIGPDATPGSALFDLAVREIVKALSIKAGQLCTNIRRILVAREHRGALEEAVAARLAGLTVGDPQDDTVRVGPLVDKGQQAQALAGIARLGAEARIVAGGGVPETLAGADREAGAFVAPTLLSCADPADGKAVHETEVFGPCATVMPYGTLDEATALAARAGGSLAVSLFSNDPDVLAETALRLAPWHGRVMTVDEEAGRNHTGHPIVMPQCVHGGPGRAGGGEELGGLRGLRFHMHRSAIQGSGTMLDRLEGLCARAAL